MKYVLRDNVYLVNGAVKSCIYDFNAEKLYSINSNLAKEVEKINNGMFNADGIDCELQSVIEKFINLGLVGISDDEIVNSHDITEIKNNISCKMAWIEITGRCNLRCIHCYNESNDQNFAVMTFDNYKIALNSIIEVGIRKIQIIGGEPFTCKRELKSFLDYTIGKVDFIEIFTNGTLIDTDWYEYLAQNNIHIALSLYSYDPFMHDKVTCINGSWKQTHKTIRALAKYKIPYRVCNVLMTDIEIGEKNTNLYTLSTEKDVVRMSGRANFKLLSKELIKKKLITKKTFQTPLKKPFCIRLASGHNCYNDRIYISVNLDVYPCVMERRIKHCTLNETQSLVLNGAIRNMTKNKINECRHCEYRYCCFDCRPNSLSGDLYEKPWYCTYNPNTGGWSDEDQFIQNLFDEWT